MVAEFFEVVVGGFRWLQVVPSFSITTHNIPSYISTMFFKH